MLIGPPAGRIPEIFDQSPLLAVPIVFTFLTVPLVHDLLVLRRIHAATWIGFSVAVAAIPLILGLRGSAAWADWLASVLGPGATG